MTEREINPRRSVWVAGLIMAMLFYVLGFTLFAGYLGLGTYGPDYPFGFAFVLVYSFGAMIIFTWYRVWLLKIKKKLINKGLVQLSTMWFFSIMYIGAGFGTLARFAILSSITPVTALVIAIVAAVDFWIIENNTKTTVDIWVSPSLER
ncbi:MAG: hypothetical protein M1151_01665 [Candidatus Thermoplasmatota archaeon]|jgi:hypothetical protein|nr:hypothetical protein [Candidatus Thermoplasmatota archaeon]MCL5785362.1 hypothetical protein [Candidatus Thermoplasmatota archaeon]